MVEIAGGEEREEEKGLRAGVPGREYIQLLTGIECPGLKTTKLLSADRLRTVFSCRKCNCLIGQVNHLCNQPPRKTQPGHPYMSSCNEYWL